MNKTYAVLSILAALILGAAPAYELSQGIRAAVTPTVVKLTRAQVQQIQRQEKPNPNTRQPNPRTSQNTSRRAASTCGNGKCDAGEAGCGAVPRKGANLNCGSCPQDCPPAI